MVAGLSTHLQTARRDAPRGGHPDEMYIDIGARNPAEVRQAGVDMLDPIALDRTLYWMGGGVTGVAIGDRFGAAALVELARRVKPETLRGTLTIAFVAQQWATSRGLDRLMQHIKPDEVVFVGRLRPRRAPAPGAQQAQQDQQTQQEETRTPRSPRKMPGSGVLIGLADPEKTPEGLAGELWKMAEENKIPVAADFTAPLPRVSYTQGPVMPQRFAQVSIAAAWPVTPAELVDSADLSQLADFLDAYAHGGKAVGARSAPAERPAPQAKKEKPKIAPSAAEVLSALVESYGVSGFEGLVRAEVSRLLPAWAKPETDDAGNLILRLGAGAKGPKLLFVAHTDEIGYVVRSIADDGRLVVQSRGGGIIEFFSGHAMLVHSVGGIRPGVMELPAGWDQPNFQWPRGAQAQLHVDIGARNVAEVERLDVTVGDSITVPKKYRKLFGTRANGRSFDDRVGCTALVAAVWELGPNFRARDVAFVWATEEEVGLRGAKAVADRLAGEGLTPDFVFAVDTFVSSDSPLESKRFADAEIGKGFVVRAVDNSNIVRREYVDRVVALARAKLIPVQYGVTGGGNDGATFLRHGTVDVPLAWALRYSHSPGEVIDVRDVEALGRIVAAIAANW